MGLQKQFVGFAKSMRSELSFCILVLALAVASGLAAEWVRRHAGWLGLLHQPNQRSSHARLTPHGGGIGIVLGGTLAGLLLAWLYPMDAEVGPVFSWSLVIAAVGLWDDIRPTPVRWRLLVQFLACGAGMLALGVADGGGLGAVGILLVILAGIWWINLFNFMDGIDGLAGMQAVFMFVAGTALMLHGSPESFDHPAWRWMVLLAGASAGFLWLNWPPAKIFMGDVGSTYLGFVLYFLGLITVNEGWMRNSVWAILGALFVCDATLTLVVRLLRGERWFEGHRDHVYQLLARHWNSHRKVSILALAINLFILLPAALAVVRCPEWEWQVVGVIYALLISLLGAVRSRIAAQQS